MGLKPSYTSTHSRPAAVPLYYLCFFFSSRRRHTRCSRDWSSDVCSSDLLLPAGGEELDRERAAAVVRADGQRDAGEPQRARGHGEPEAPPLLARGVLAAEVRSEERRVGKECRSRWSACQSANEHTEDRQP